MFDGTVGSRVRTKRSRTCLRMIRATPISPGISISPRPDRQYGNISRCLGSGRNGGPPMQSSSIQAISAGELALRINACTEKMPSSKRCWIGVPRLFYREYPTSDPGGLKNHANPCLSRPDNWLYAYRNASWQAQAEGQGLCRSSGSEVQRKYHQGIEKLRLMVEEQQTSPSVIDEPPLIASSERFLTDPVKSNAS